MKQIKIYAIILIILVLSLQGKAQLFSEWDARPNIAIKYKVNKSLAFTATYYHYLESNMMHYNKSVAGLDAAYKINSWLKAGIDYRYGFNAKQNYHDIRYSATIDFNFSPKWKIAYRPMLQQEFVSLKKEHLATDPIEYFLRNRITFSFDATPQWELYAFTETYLELEKENTGFYRQKSALGGDNKINQHHKIGFRFEVINKKNGKITARPNLGYTYTFGYWNKKS